MKMTTIPLSSLHRHIYDHMAEEYEERVGDLLSPTQEAMDYFSSHLKPGSRILDVGCGVGLALHVLSRKGFRTEGIDISPRMAAFAKRRNPKTSIAVGDFLTTPFKTKFDGVLTFAFIHLFPKEKTGRIFRKMRSLLKQDGLAYISSTESPISKEGWEIKEDYRKKEKRFRKFWTEQELAETIEYSGFEIVALKKFPDPFGKVWMDFVAKKV